MIGELSEADAIAGTRAARLATEMAEDGLPLPSIVAALMTTAIEMMRTSAGEDAMKLWLARTAGSIING